MTNSLTISIITPSYNQGAYLAQTIESVLSQEGEFRIEYLIMDGGSTDESLAIIRHYDGLLRNGAWPVRCAGIDFRWHSGPDRGQSDALQRGFSQARGEILAWLNSDDFYYPGALQAACDAFREHPETALLYGAAHYCDPAGVTIGSYRTADFDYLTLASFNFICQPSTFFRADAYRAVGGVDGSLHFAMDYDLWIRMARRFPCHYLPRVLSSYRLHDASKTIRDDILSDNVEEGLAVVRRHYGWAPVTRVYPACRLRLKARLPAPLAGCRPLLIVLSLGYAVLRSLALNRGVRAADLRLLTPANLGKLFKSRSEIMLGGGDGSRQPLPKEHR